MITNHIEKLTTLYDSAEKEMPYFKRNVYDQAFKKVYEANLATFDELNADLEGQSLEFVEDYLAELADAFVSIFKTEYDQIEKKGKRNSYLTDHNTPIVIYVFPAILYYGAKWCKPCVETLVAKWNEAFTEVTIGYGTYEDIKAGFKYKLCYVTTAVCDSLNKPDDCIELTMLRDYRDNVLAKEEGGEQLIEEYYDIAPTIVKRINRSENPEAEYNRLYTDFILKCIDNIENKNYEQCRFNYTSMVTELKNKYAY